jgi:molecular chaperone HtpG
MKTQGTLSVHTENIFPIIKKFLYSDHEIFLRELVSNAVDATQKLQFLSSKGEFEGETGPLKIKITLDKDAKTLTISDNGIGMSAEEVEQYINQIAFSGAEAFLEKYKDLKDSNQIIGHFGLGFYSAFMVASKVEMVTKSYTGAEAVKWTCDGSTSFTMEPSDTTERGTSITLFLADDAQEFLESHRISGILQKYCRYLPIEIEFEEKVINTLKPAWTKAPKTLEDKDYLDFYHELYPYEEDPIFWIHLNVDYPFTLTGILYFPKIKPELDPRKNGIQLYSRQVFITDAVQDIVPEYLLLLRGVLDSPDIPLNVSRSYLQADQNVRKITGHISKKVADKLKEIFREDRKAFEEKWDMLNIFLKYGMLSEDEFYEKVKECTLFKTTEGEYHTLESLQESFGEKHKDKNGTTVWLYTSDPAKQDSYIRSAKSAGFTVLVLDAVIDPHFVGFLERKLEKVSFARVDSGSLRELIPQENEDAAHSLGEAGEKSLKDLFAKTSTEGERSFTVESLGKDDLPVVLVKPEFMRRFKEMNALGGQAAMFPETTKWIINADHPVIIKLSLDVEEKPESMEIAKQACDLALLAQGMLESERMTDFLHRSAALLGK